MGQPQGNLPDHLTLKHYYNIAIHLYTKVRNRAPDALPGIPGKD
ncbi:hypothetical protein P3T24_001872 [Paraburkholderia sp. GAS33]